MIELRWVERMVKQEHGYPDLPMLVLQYRISNDDMITRWSDWQDVPTVKEGEGGKA